MLKDLEVNLDITSKRKELITTSAMFYSRDINTSKILIHITRKNKEIVLSSEAKVYVLMLFDEESETKKHLYTANFEEKNIYSIVLPEKVLGYEGIITAGVYIDYQNEQSADAGYFSFHMKRSMLDEDFPEIDTIYVSEFEKALEEIQEILRKFDGVEMDIDEKIKQIEQAIEQHELEVEQKLNDINTSVDDRLTQINNNLDGTEEELNKRIDVIEKDIASNGIAKQEELDNLEVGGLNLLDGTKRFSQPWRTAGETPIKDSDGFFYVRLKNTYTEWAYIRFDEWEKGEEYILSFYARSEQDVSLNPKIEIAGSPVWEIPITSREFKRYEIKFVWNFESSPGVVQLLTRQNTTYIDVKKVKLEKANKSIGWQPSINETVDKMDVSDLQKQINELKNAITTLGGTL